jgi:hypothetical protein
MTSEHLILLQSIISKLAGYAILALLGVGIWKILKKVFKGKVAGK